MSSLSAFACAWFCHRGRYIRATARRAATDIEDIITDFRGQSIVCEFVAPQRSRFARFVRLNDLPGSDIPARKIAAATVRECVDADRVTEVERQAALLRRVPDDHGFAGKMCLRVPQFLPVQDSHVLLRHRGFKFGSGVHENMRFRLVERQGVLQESPVLRRHVVEGAAVGCHRRATPDREPLMEIQVALCPRFHQHDVVIAAYRNEVSLVYQSNQPVEDAASVGAPVHVITEQDQGVGGVGLDLFEQRIQRDPAAVNVADGEGSVHYVSSPVFALNAVRNVSGARQGLNVRASMNAPLVSAVTITRPVAVSVR